MLAVIGRGVVAAILLMGLGIVAMLAGVLGGNTASDFWFLLWYVIAIVLLVWVVSPFFSASENRSTTESSAIGACKESTDKKKG